MFIPSFTLMTMLFGFLASPSTSSIVIVSILLYAYKHLTYFLFPTMTSMIWSTSTSSRTRTSALRILWTLSMLATTFWGSSPSFVSLQVALNLMPPATSEASRKEIATKLEASDDMYRIVGSEIDMPKFALLATSHLLSSW